MVLAPAQPARLVGEHHSSTSTEHPQNIVGLGEDMYKVSRHGVGIAETGERLQLELQINIYNLVKICLSTVLTWF